MKYNNIIQFFVSSKRGLEDCLTSYIVRKQLKLCFFLVLENDQRIV